LRAAAARQSVQAMRRKKRRRAAESMARARGMLMLTANASGGSDMGIMPRRDRRGGSRAALAKWRHDALGDIAQASHRVATRTRLACAAWCCASGASRCGTHARHSLTWKERHGAVLENMKAYKRVTLRALAMAPQLFLHRRTRHRRSLTTCQRRQHRHTAARSLPQHSAHARRI